MLGFGRFQAYKAQQVVAFLPVPVTGNGSRKFIGSILRKLTSISPQFFLAGDQRCLGGRFQGQTGKMLRSFGDIIKPGNVGYFRVILWSLVHFFFTPWCFTFFKGVDQMVWYDRNS